MERRQYKRKSLGEGQELRVSLFLNSKSLVYEGRTEDFEIEANAFDVSRGGLGIQLEFSADFIGFSPNNPVVVRVHKPGQDVLLPAQVSHFEPKRGRIGVQFHKPLADLSSFGF